LFNCKIEKQNIINKSRNVKYSGDS
jgi:hypothetical protein